MQPLAEATPCGDDGIEKSLLAFTPARVCRIGEHTAAIEKCWQREVGATLFATLDCRQVMAEQVDLLCEFSLVNWIVDDRFPVRPKARAQVIVKS